MSADPDRPYDAVLLAGFGGPEGPDDVMPFLRNVTRGRGVPDERLAEVAHHYLALGGVSPINAQNRALRAAIEDELRRRGIELPVLWGNRNWAPYLTDTVRDAAASGRTRLLGVATSAYSSYSSCRQYREDFARALLDSGTLGTVRIDKLRPYYDLPGFLEPVVDGVAAAIESAAAAGVSSFDLRVVFTTHSVPLSMAAASGGDDDGPLYVAQHQAACVAVMDRIGLRVEGSVGWQLAYQSRSGSPHVPWLEPDINDVLAALVADGVRGVVVVPIGFVTDHVEVVWDLDTEAAQTAGSLGLWYSRVATSGPDPRFVSGLADLIAQRLDPSLTRTPSSTELRARPDRCPEHCCAAARLRPTTAAVDSQSDWAGVDVEPHLLAGSGICGAAAPTGGAADTETPAGRGATGGTRVPAAVAGGSAIGVTTSPVGV